MDGARMRDAVIRFTAGCAGGAAASAALHELRLFHKGLALGALTAGLLALVRARLHAQAVLLIGAATAFQVGAAWRGDVARALTAGLASLLLGGGVLVSAILFDRLAAMGCRWGKFALLGSLLGGVYLAVTPITAIGRSSAEATLAGLWLNTFLGAAIGCGTGFGVELADGLMRRLGR